MVRGVGDILERIRAYSPDADVEPVMASYVLAARAHNGQVRKSGESYLTHPLAVAEILIDMRMDVDTIATALLHDALEDNPITKEEMAAEVGPVITELVDGVTKIGKLKFRSKEELAAENFRKMMLAMSKDLRVVLVKLADRLHNMRTIEHHGEEKQRLIARETLEIYVPLAGRLGIDRIRSELDDICFRVLEPESYETITAYISQTQADRELYINEVLSEIREQLEQGNLSAAVKGRAKGLFSIHRKTVQKGYELCDITDLMAFRVLVDDVSDCYAALGLIHACYPPLVDRIKDYVARPKPNGYQSLHTTVVGPQERAIEIQIRTHSMDRIAEEGIAAHWRYKEGHLALSPSDVAKVGRIREIFESAREAQDARDFMEALKFEFYSDEVFVFTPAGDVKCFPRGATALDFAYAVHTDVGNTCVGAKVHGKLVPIRYALKSGDQVEILTSNTQTPRRDWLEIARTGRAISKIRRHMREEEREVGLRIGREMVDAELRSQGWSFEKVEEEGRFQATLARHEAKDLNGIFLDVARGHLSAHHVVRDLLPEGAYQSKQEATAITALLNRIRPRTESPVLITGEDGVLVQFAGCCSPLPGEPIAGFITRGRGITVHTVGCEQLASMDKERHVAVAWDAQSAQSHTGEVQIFCTDRTGMLANITRVCEQLKVNIQRVDAQNLGQNQALCRIRVSIGHVDHLSQLIKTLERLPGVTEVNRVMG